MSESAKTTPWLIVHVAIIAGFVAEIAHTLYQIFYAIAPGEVSGLLGEVANNIDADLLVARRLYAVEFVLAFAGLALYLAVTEIAPRLQKARSNT